MFEKTTQIKLVSFPDNLEMLALLKQCKYMGKNIHINTDVLAEA